MNTSISNLFQIKPLRLLRQTEGVEFHVVPLVGESSIDRVIHDPGAHSPGAVGSVKRPWYCHPNQEDNILVLHGRRWVELYTKEDGIYEFEVTAEQIFLNGELICDEPALLSWPTDVFHRVRSCEKEGSHSVNFAVHKPGFNINTNFNIYDLDTDTGKFEVIREGHLDQSKKENV